jgi:hypothetical protein
MRTQHAQGQEDYEIAGYLQKGFLLRMRGEISGQVNLIAASAIKKLSDSQGSH